MLKFFRDQKDSWFVKGILILTALSFMSLFGIQGATNLRQSNKTVVKTGNIKITAQQFLGIFDARIAEQRALMGIPFPLQDALNAGMLSYVFNDTVTKAIAAESADAMNIGVSDDEVRDAILNNSMFLGADGAFNRSAFREFLNKTGKTEKTYVEETKDRLRSERLFETAATATVVPDDLALFYYQTHKEKRSADIIRIVEKNISVVEKPSEKELTALYESLSDRLMAPEYRKMSIMTLTLDNIKNTITVTEADLKDLYEQRSDRFVTEETRTVNQMLFDTESAANAAYQAVKKGKPFLTVAETDAKQTRDQTELGAVVKAGLLTEIADPVFDAKKGALLPPVQTAFGWQVLQVTDTAPRKVVSFANAKAELEKEYKDLRAYDKLMDLSVKIEDMLGEGKSLEDIALTYRLNIVKTDFTDITGLDEKGKNTTLSQDILSVAFIGEENQTSPMIEQENGFFTVRIDDVRMPQVKSPDAARKDLVALWTAEKRHEKALSLADSILADAEKGKPMADIAQKNGLKVDTLKDFDRQEKSLSRSFLTLLFNQKKNGVAKTTTQDGYIVAKITKINKVDAKNDDIGLWEIKEELKKKTAFEKADALLQDFSKYFKTHINQETLREIEAHLKKATGPSAETDD